MTEHTDINLITKHIEKNIGKIGAIFHGVNSSGASPGYLPYQIELF